MQTVISGRISSGLVTINGMPCSRVVAAKETKCHHSHKPIKRGDAVYRPIGNPKQRSARWLASEIEAIEAAR